jgi:lysozyme
MSWRVAALIVLSTAACSSDETRSGEPIGTSQLEVVVCADGEQLEGIDVSYYQDQPDWNAVAGDGIVYAITRVNHGDFMDPEFDTNWAAIKEVGLVRGAYQYFDPSGDPVTQAQTLIDKVGTLGPGDLPPVIDVESTDGLGPEVIAANVRTWVDMVEGATGRRPLIYTGSYFWNDNVQTDEFAGYPLWIAHYTTDCPNLPAVWGDWVFWQYSSTGNVAGIYGAVDENRFNGTLEQLHDLAGNGYRASVVALDYPETLTAGERGTVELTLRNDGARTWSSHTRLGTTTPRDRESAFASDDWDSANRVAGMPKDVASGDTVTLSFTVVAPDEPGEYLETFNLVEEAVAWFSDTPPGGGPTDDSIALRIAVLEGEPPSSTAAGTATLEAEIDGSCAFGKSRESAWWLLLALGAISGRRGRRASRRR